MQRTEFLDELQQHLSILSHEDRENILEEYRVYFTECEKEGKTEEEICDELGEPIECAKQYLGDIALEDVQTVKIDKNQEKKMKRKKVLWTLAFLWNVVQAIVSIPTTSILFIVAGLMVVFFCFVVPVIESVAFLCFAIFSTLSVFLLAMITFLWTIIEIQTCIKKINGEGK